MAAAQEEDPTFCYLQWNNPQEGPYISDPADMPTSLNAFKKFTQRVTPTSNRVCWMKLCIASENVDPRIFVQGGPERSILDHWLENNAVMSCRHAGNSKVKELIKPTVYATTLQKSPNSVRIGELLGIGPVMSDTKGYSTELNREVNVVAELEGWGPVELGVEFSNTKIGTFDSEKGKYKWPYLPHRTLAIEVNRECAARTAQFIHRRTNKVKEVTKRPWSLDCRFIPDEAFSDISASASPIWHGNMFRRHTNLTNCMAPPIYTSVIKDLHAVATIKGIQITLKDYLLHITYPLVPPVDECGRPCILDKKGNVVRDMMGCPKKPERIFYQIFTDMSQGHKSAWQTVLLTAKDRAALAKTLVSVLPAFVHFATGGECPEEWFDDTRDHIIATTEFLTDNDGNFNGKIRTAADKEALDMLKDDNFFGIQEFEIEGLELLEQADATIAIAQPWDQVTTGTAKDPEDFGQRPTAGGDDNSSIASDSSHAQQEKGSVTTPVHGQPASPTGTGGLAV